MRRLALLAPFAVAALIAGCGSSSSSSSSAPATSSSSASASSTQAAATQSAGKLALTETEFKIAPASPTVSKAGKVTITVKNSGKITHALAVQTPSGLVNTGPIAPGATATLTVDAAKAGKYTFFCPLGNHRQLGMQGTLVVGSGGASAAATSSPASSSSSSGY
jgi:uncharacterized cupredoxin-like copper-binding protein